MNIFFHILHENNKNDEIFHGSENVSDVKFHLRVYVYKAAIDANTDDYWLRFYFIFLHINISIER